MASMIKMQGTRRATSRTTRACWPIRAWVDAIRLQRLHGPGESRIPMQHEHRSFTAPERPISGRQLPECSALKKKVTADGLKMAAFLTHQQKVLRLYKKSLRHLESWCIFRDKYRFYACMLRARFDESKNEKDMMKATMLLKAGEEEFWTNQHPQPYIFPDSPGGTSYERYECYKVPEWLLDHWHPSEKAMYPDYFSKREQWKKLRMQSWDKEVAQLQAENQPKDEALPPARKEGDLPPLWWQYVTRPRERPT